MFLSVCKYRGTGVYYTSDTLELDWIALVGNKQSIIHFDKMLPFFFHSLISNESTKKRDCIKILKYVRHVFEKQQFKWYRLIKSFYQLYYKIICTLSDGVKTQWKQDSDQRTPLTFLQINALFPINNQCRLAFSSVAFTNKCFSCRICANNSTLA